jgi:hypothetical protein
VTRWGALRDEVADRLVVGRHPVRCPVHEEVHQLVVVSVSEDSLGHASHGRPPRGSQEVPADHALDNGLDVVVVQHFERTADDGGAFFGHALGTART